MLPARDQTRDIFDCIATYFVNTYWTHLYKHAFDSYTERQYNTIDDSYKVMADRYRVAFCVTHDAQGKENKNYIKIITDLHNNYNVWMKSDLSLGDFIDIVCRQIIPEDVYKNLGRQDNRKDELFRKTITQAVTNFTYFVSTMGVNDVINVRDANRSEPKKSAWKEEFIKILYHERDELSGRFMATKIGVDPSKREKNQISREAFDKMTIQIKKLIYEKAAIQKELNTFIFAARKQQEVDRAKIAELTAMLSSDFSNNRKVALRVAPQKAALPKIEELPSEEESSEASSNGSLEKINDPAKDTFLKKGKADSSITAPLDELSSYSGDDAPAGLPKDESDDDSSSMSMDE